MILMIIVLLVIVLMTIIIYRKISRPIGDRDIYFQSLEDKKHEELGHKRVRSIVDLKMGRFDGHWEDKNGNEI